VLPPQTHIGTVHLTIQDLARSVRFYERHLGLRVNEQTDFRATVGVGHTLLVLHAAPSAVRARDTTGLYHFAILVPSRADLARALRRLVDTETPMQGAADHGVSEALYLADPDGNGIEIYRDRPREEWPVRAGHLHMVTDPLDVAGLIDEADTASDGGMVPGTTMGHVHLHVAHLDAAEQFYVGVLGFDLMQRYGSSAAFVSAGGYHHHVGFNTWAGVGAPPPPAGAIGLRHFEIVLPTPAALAEVVERARAHDVAVETDDNSSVLTAVVRDPSSNVILLSAP